MIKITLFGRRDQRGTVREACVEVPAVPRLGEHIDHTPSGIEGTVCEVTYWWGGKASEVEIQVTVK